MKYGTRFAVVIAILCMALGGCGEKAKEPPMTPQQQAQLAEQQEKDKIARKQEQTDKAVELYRSVQANQNTAIENAVKNANAYRDASPRLEGTSVISHPDPMLNAECLQGSGWIWITFMGKKNTNVLDASGKPTVEKYKAYCSTHSSAIGCFLEDDLKNLPYWKELKQCNIGIPLPFKTL